MATKKAPIKYTSKEFDTIKTELVKYAKRYYPDTYKDFGDASFGSLALDSVAYVGDMLSFYLDYQVNESFLDTATEVDNIIKLSNQLGYKHEGSPSSIGVVDLFIICPANATGLGPDANYLPIVEAGFSLGSDAGAFFTTTEDIRFDDTNNDVVAARIDDSTGIPTHYAVRAKGEVISGEIQTAVIKTEGYEKFKKIKLPVTGISEIISVMDSAGHEYLEVEYLSQNLVYRDVANRGSDSDKVASIIKPFVAPRRFVTENLSNETFLQFGYGSESELAQPSVAEPSSMAMQMHARNYISDETFDPSKLIATDKFGIAPADTTLTISYRTNTSSNVNVPTGALKRISNRNIKFKDATGLSSEKMNSVRTSLECSNSSPILGGTGAPGVTEIKRRAKDSFATQNRAVTRQDLEAMSYMMPSKYGAIKRCATRKTKCATRRNIEFYVLAEDSSNKLITATDSLKNNLKLWLSEKKMINDSMDIRDAKIINYGVEFSIIVNPSENKYDVLKSAIKTLQEEMKEPSYIGEPLYITDVYGILNRVRGVVDTKNVKIFSKSGAGYSSNSVDIDSILSADGLTVETPDNVALEVKYPLSDIKGSVE